MENRVGIRCECDVFFYLIYASVAIFSNGKEQHRLIAQRGTKGCRPNLFTIPTNRPSQRHGIPYVARTSLPFRVSLGCVYGECPLNNWSCAAKQSEC